MWIRLLESSRKLLESSRKLVVIDRIFTFAIMLKCTVYRWWSMYWYAVKTMKIHDIIETNMMTVITIKKSRWPWYSLHDQWKHNVSNALPHPSQQDNPWKPFSSSLPFTTRTLESFVFFCFSQLPAQSDDDEPTTKNRYASTRYDQIVYVSWNSPCLL